MKKGFTLAEVLLTLGIIGVIAAVTIPTLVTNTRGVKIGPSLLKFKNSIENAFEQIKADEMSSTLSLASIAELPQYLHMTSYNDTQVYNYTSPDGSSKHGISTKYYNELHEICIERQGSYPGCEDDAGLNSRDSYASTLNDGMVIVINPASHAFKDDYTGPLKGIIAEILVDIDGDKSVNKAGKDVFAFLLDRSGVLVPYGSQELQQALKNKEEFHLFFGAAGTGSFQNGYAGNNNCKTSGNNAPDALACTGAIAQNGWSTNGIKGY